MENSLQETQLNQLKTGTTTVGLVCRDGIVIGADRRATAGYLVVDKRAQKVHIINDSIALTIAGNVSDAQLLIKLFKAELKLKEIQTNRRVNMKEAANLLGGFLYSAIRQMSMMPAITHFLLAGVDNLGYHLYDLYPDGSVTEVVDYTSSGSGSVMAFGLLENLYRKDLNVEEGVKLIIKSINSALQRDIATGNGVDVVTITKDGVKKAVEKELEAKLTL